MDEEEIQIIYGKKNVLKLNGSNEFVDCGRFPHFRSDKGLTVTCWFKPTGFKNTYLVVNQGGGWSYRGFSIYVVNGNLRIEVQNKKKVFFDNSGIEKDKWNHVGFCYDKEQQKVWALLNGARLSTVGKFEGDFTNVTTNLNFGRSQQVGQYLQGEICQVKIFNKCLGESQVKKEMYCFDEKKSLENKNLVGYWPLSSDLKNLAGRKENHGYSKTQVKFVESTLPIGEKLPHVSVEKENYSTILNNLFSTGYYSDVTLKVKGHEDKPIKAHKCILSSFGNKLKDMLKDKSEVVFDCDYDSFKSCIDYIYGAECEINGDNVDIMVKTSDYLDIAKVREGCFAYMVKSLTPDTVIPTMLKAQRGEFDFDAKDLIKQCVTVIEKKTEAVLATDHLFAMNQGLLLETIKSDKLNIDEMDLYDAVQRWAKRHSADNKLDINKLTQPLLKHIRFPLMDKKDLLTIIKNDPNVDEELYLQALEYQLTPSRFKDSKDPQFKSRAKLFKKSLLLKSKWGFQLKKWVGKKDFGPKGWNLLYRASKDGWTCYNFHAKVDSKGPTITIIKSTNGNIFGGYNAQSWTPNGSYLNNNKSFVFSLKNAKNTPVKCDFIPGKSGPYSYSSYGPTFGGGHDIYICSNPHNTTSNYSNLGHSFKAPYNWNYGSTQAKNFLAGSYNFKVAEIEIYGKPS